MSPGLARLWSRNLLLPFYTTMMCTIWGSGHEQPKVLSPLACFCLSTKKLNAYFISENLHAGPKEVKNRSLVERMTQFKILL